MSMSNNIKLSKYSGNASIDGDFSIGDIGELNSSLNTSSVNHKSSSKSFEFDYAKEHEEIAKEDQVKIQYFKYLVITVLVVLAVTVSIVVFVTTRQGETSDFEEEYSNRAHRIALGWENHFGLHIRSLESLSIHIVSWAAGSQSIWPMVTVPDFEARGESTRGFSDSESIVLLPIVINATIEEYEFYVQENLGWIPAEDRQNVSPFISTVDTEDNDSIVPVSGVGPFFPAWSMSPVDATQVNLDYGVDRIHGTCANEAFASELVVMGDIFDESQFSGSSASSTQIEQPLSLLYLPVFDEDELVALLATNFNWITALESSISGEDEGNLMVVVENTCGQVVSFEINGSTVQVIGESDAHDPNYDSYMELYSFDSMETAMEDFVVPSSPLKLNVDKCPYTIRIYPTENFEDEFRSASPWLYTFSIICIFLLTAGVFGCYDVLMERRQRHVLSIAIESRALVASLFPKQFQGRLFEHQRRQLKGRMRKLFRVSRSSEASNRDDTENGSPSSSHLDDEAHSEQGHDTAKRPSLVSHSTLRIKNYLNESSGMLNIEENLGRPIADLFPNTTVLFGDIVGFTSWCSQRDPEKVFTLLESIFKAFDKSARKRGVFKVETIGDCYMAVTGLPDPQEDHAWRMAKFALDARNKMTEVLQELETTLGPDTSDLSMRFGMHSGPTTAGVLRGDKTRFQLFGDTVNTASRMESTGIPNRIQVSHTTAECLRELGKGGWLRARTKAVQAKGKGEVKTFWLASRSNEDSLAPLKSKDEFRTNDRSRMLAMASAGDQVSIRMGLSDFSDSEEEEDVQEQEMMVNGHMSTLFEGEPPERKQDMKKRNKVIMWQAELLIQSLRQLVARRGQMRNLPTDVSGIVFRPREGKVVIDEVTDSFELQLRKKKPSFKVDPDDVILSPTVLSQVHDYVSMIASMHNDQLPFHNFEHASHVAMSAMKLLHPIVISQGAGGKASDYSMSTGGVNSDPMVQFAIVFASLIQ